MSGIQLVNRELLDAVTAAAQGAPRLRKNHNLHHGDNAACHRLLNAIEPGSYIRPHRHLDPEKDESLVVVRGTLGIVTFDERGEVTATYLLRAGGESIAVDVRHGVCHTAISLEKGTVFFEAKAGPYLPLTDAEKGAFAPDEGTPEAAAYLATLTGLFS